MLTWHVFGDVSQPGNCEQIWLVKKTAYIHTHTYICCILENARERNTMQTGFGLFYVTEIAHKFQNSSVNTAIQTKTKNPFPLRQCLKCYYDAPTFLCKESNLCLFTFPTMYVWNVYAVFLWWDAKLVGALPPVRVNTLLLTLLCEIQVFCV